MNPSHIQIAGTICFFLAVIHTFMAKSFEKISHRYEKDSMGENLFHFLGEIEAVFGIWSALFIIYYSFTEGLLVTNQAHQTIGGAIHFLEGLNFTEPAFVFVIMCIAGTRPVIILAEKMIEGFSKILPFKSRMAFYISALSFGPLLGSFITEPAAMTVTALILLDYFYSKTDNLKFKYATIGLLFVNVSIGGTLSHFAAPPVLMVAGKWGWDLNFMLTNFGYKAAIAVVINTLLIAYLFRKELSGSLPQNTNKFSKAQPKWWIYLVHIFFLILVVFSAHHMVFFMGLFLFFLGFSVITREFQDEIKLKESLLVGFFLGGLVVLGSQQGWWLKEILTKLSDTQLFFGATGLTGITDNAALTYLGSLVDLSESAKYNLVAGAVVGGGLTVIANAPNPAGFGILKITFGKEGIKPLGLLKSALIPTLIACLALKYLP